jgi:hypothetical protein
LEWGPFFTFSLLALVIPVLGGWARRWSWVSGLFGTLSPHSDGLSYIIHEARPRGSRREGIWVTAKIETGEVHLGQLLWRSTPPDPLQIVLARVRDLTDPEERDHEEDWVMWLPGSSIKEMWIHIPSQPEEEESDADIWVD